MLSFFLCLFVLVNSRPLPPPWVPPNWIVYEPLTDDFDDNSLDATKWYGYDPYWLGRPPGLFVSSNVKVSNGNLELWCQGNVTLNESMQEKGYNNYTTSAVVSINKVRYHYTEIRAKSGTSKITSSFWIQSDGTNATEGNELDVFENTGPINNTAYNYGQMSSHTYIFKYPNTNKSTIGKVCNCTVTTDSSGQLSCYQANLYTPNFDNFSDEFHIFGLFRSQNIIQVSLDGIIVWNMTNYCVDMELPLIFDRETWTWLPNGLPTYDTLPDQPFTIDYVHTWIPPN